MFNFVLPAAFDVDELAAILIDDKDSETILDLIKALEAAVDDWDFTKQIRDWAKAEIKEAKRLGYTS